MKFPWLLLFVCIVFIGIIFFLKNKYKNEADIHNSAADSLVANAIWQGKGLDQIPTETEEGKLIAYGRDLIANTSIYLGPNGTVAHTTNGMNCQNCHLEAGTKPWGNNYGGVFANYPQVRSRSGTLQSIYDRINDCFERSLNGQKLDTSTHEMQAMYSYIKWLGEDVPKNTKPAGIGIQKLPFLDRAADPEKGKIVYIQTCKLCHGAEGEGLQNPEKNGYTFPPLWGKNSYNDGAGLFRLSNFAGFVKNNMPQGISNHAPQLTDEEAWDVAAFVNSQPRPHKDQSMDFKDLTKKPFDCAFGPYNDTFSVAQHKYGPYAPIVNANKN